MLVDIITSDVVAVTAVGSTSDVVSLTTVGRTVPISVLCGGTSEVNDVLVGWMTSVDESVTDAAVGMFVPVLCGGMSVPVLEALVGGTAVAEDSGGVIATSDVVSLTTVGRTVPISVLCGGTSEVSDVLVAWMTSVDESVTDAAVGMFVPVLCGGMSVPVLEALVGGTAVAEDSGGVIAKILVMLSAGNSYSQFQ